MNSRCGASYFLGVSEWTFRSLLPAGFWDNQASLPIRIGQLATIAGWTREAKATIFFTETNS